MQIEAPTHIHAKKAETGERLQAEGLMRNYWEREERGNEVKMKGETKLSLTIC